MARNIPLKALSIAAWHGWLARRGLAALFGVYTAQQLVLLLAAARAARQPRLRVRRAVSAHGAGHLLPARRGGGAGAGFGGALVGRPLRGRDRPSHAARRAVEAAGRPDAALCGGGSRVCGLAAAALLRVLPAGRGGVHLAAAGLSRNPARAATGGLYEQLAQNPLLQVLLPTYPLGWAALAIDLAALAVQGGCIFIHRGWRRLPAALLALPTAVGALALPILAGMIQLRTAGGNPDAGTSGRSFSSPSP